MASVKTEVLSVRVKMHSKEALQMGAEREMRNLANMVEVMMEAYCRAQGDPLEGVPDGTLSNTSRRGSAA